MSDAINDVDKESRKEFLSSIEPKRAAQRLRELRGAVVEYEKIRRALSELGYKVEEKGNTVTVWEVF